MKKKALILIALILAFANSGALIASDTASATYQIPKQTYCEAQPKNATQPYKLSEDSKLEVMAKAEAFKLSAKFYPNIYKLGLVVTSIDVAQDNINTSKKWGNIVPSFNYKNIYGQNKTYSGLNNTTEGMAILENKCQYILTDPTPEVWFFDNTASCSNRSASYTIPSISGVRYYVTLNDDPATKFEAAPTTYTVNTTTKVGIVAEAVYGYTLNPSSTSTWSETLTVPTEESCAPNAVTFVQPTCSALGTYTIPTTEGIYYMLSINGEKEQLAEADTFSVPNGTTITVNAFRTDSEKSTVREVNSEIKQDALVGTWTNVFKAPTNCGSVLGTSTVKSLPNTSGTGMNPVAYIAAFSIAFMALAGAAMKRFYTERL